MKIIINGRVFNGSKLKGKKFSADLDGCEDFEFIGYMVNNVDHHKWMPVLIIDGEHKVSGKFKVAHASAYDFYSRSEFTFEVEKDFRYE